MVTMVTDYEVEGGWGNPDKPGECRGCGTVKELVPREGHFNSKYWQHERGDGLKLHCCPNGCSEKKIQTKWEADHIPEWHKTAWFKAAHRVKKTKDQWTDLRELMRSKPTNVVSQFEMLKEMKEIIDPLYYGAKYRCAAVARLVNQDGGENNEHQAEQMVVAIMEVNPALDSNSPDPFKRDAPEPTKDYSDTDRNGGWFSPTGAYFQCRNPQDHLALGDDIRVNCPEEMARIQPGQDWVKTIDYEGWMLGRGDCPPTAKQRDAIWDWAHTGDGPEQASRTRAYEDFMVVYND